MSEIPRPLRDVTLLSQIRALDEAYRLTGHTGPMVIELHYAQGSPRKAKVRSEQDFAITLTSVQPR